MMKILIDADGCPVTEITCKEAGKYNLKCVIICDTSHIFNYPDVETITVSKGADSVDFFLVNIIDKGDIVVTQDYGLAAMCLAKNAFVINQNGIIFDDGNILSLLNVRHTSKKLRMSGVRLKGPSKRDKTMDAYFIEKLKFLIEKNL
ncbi:MAG: YaiI/YqxD family protein [Ruminococcaceae bacterium]|nr:YaiI/YqxD family protein [Oscillospiraceae bacterium]